MTDFYITQTGTTLTSTSTIKLVKYENKVSRLVFKLDGTIPEELRLYLAFCNPLTKKYSFEPLLYDETDPYVIIGTEITYYPSKRWEILLIGISPDTFIDEIGEIDDTLVVWSSLPFKKMVVLETFLDDDAVLITHPNIEKQLADLTVLHDNVVSLAVQTGEDVTECNQIFQECRDILDQINQIYNDYLSTEQRIRSSYESYMSSMESTFNQYLTALLEAKEGGE